MPPAFAGKNGGMNRPNAGMGPCGPAGSHGGSPTAAAARTPGPRRLALGAAALAAAAAITVDSHARDAPAAPDPAAPAGPNILWLIAEDMGPELACFGNPDVRTPNLDRLASEGVRFDRAFTVTPVCSTSRSSFMTGMYAFTIGAHNHRSHRDGTNPLPDGVRVLTDWLRPAGYFTANVVDFSGGTAEAGFRGTGKTDWNFTVAGAPFDSRRWADLKANQPFFAQVNFPETHRGREWNEAHETADPPADPDTVTIPPCYPDHPVTRADWAQYLNAVMALDRKVGAVLARLEEDGLADRTIVFFFSDHGRATVRGKQWPYDSGLRVPLIVRWPEGAAPPPGWEPGSVSRRLVESIDWSATTLALAGVPKPEAMQGRVFIGSHDEGPRNYVHGGRDRGDETVDRIRTVRDGRFRYLRNYHPDRPFLQTNRYKEATYPVLRLMRRLHAEGRLGGPPAALMAPIRPIEELYDTEADPHEIHNLATSAEHRPVLERMRRELDGWLADIDDQGRFPEPAEVVAKAEESMAATYDERLRKLAEDEERSGSIEVRPGLRIPMR